MTFEPSALIPVNAISEPSLATTAIVDRQLNIHGHTSTNTPADFGKLITDGLQQVNQSLNTTQRDLQKLALGETGNLHQIMIRMEETRISFQLMMQVRNRMLEAYQDIMKMQI
jgi:flagellar hook-basal body complex protein FliE